MKFAQRLQRLVPEAGIGKAVALLAGGTAIGQLFSFAVVPLTTRLFSPEAFGVLATYTAVLMTVQTIAGMCFEAAIPVVPTVREAMRLVVLGLLSVAMVSLAMLGVVALSQAGVVRLPSVGAPAVVLWLLPVGLALSGMYQVFRYWAVREKAYRDIAATTVSRNVGRGLIQVGAGLVSHNPLGLVLAEIAGQTAGSARLGRSALPYLRSMAADLRWKDLWLTAKARASFPMLLAPATLLNAAGLQVPTILIASLYGPRVAGLYFATQRLLSIPLQLLANAFGQAFLGEAGTLAREDPAKLKRMFNSVSWRLFAIGVLPTVILVAIAPPLMAFLLGAEWRESGVYLQWLALGFLFKFSFVAMINFAIVERNDYALYWAGARLVVAAGSVIVSHRLGLSAVTCIAFLGSGVALCYLLQLYLWNLGLRGLERRLSMPRDGGLTTGPTK